MKTNPTRWITLVTGGCGYVGRHLCLRLLALGHHVFLVDDLSRGLHPDIWLKEAIRERRTDGPRIIYQVGQAALEDAPTVTFIKADLIVALREQAVLARVGQAQNLWPDFEAAFHLANTQSEPRALQHQPTTAGLKLALDACFFFWATERKDHVGRVVYVGTGEQQASEQASPLARQLALTLSQAGQQLAQAAAVQEGLRVASIVPSSLYGKDQGHPHVVPAIALHMLQNSPTVQLPPHLDHAYELLHIDDCVAALLHAADKLKDGVPVAIGTGKFVDAAEIVHAMAELQNRVVQVQTHKSSAATPSPGKTTDPARMHQALGVRPQITLQTGLAQALRAAQRRMERGVQRPVVAVTANTAPTPHA